MAAGPPPKPKSLRFPFFCDFKDPEGFFLGFRVSGILKGSRVKGLGFFLGFRVQGFRV